MEKKREKNRNALLRFLLAAAVLTAVADLLFLVNHWRVELDVRGSEAVTVASGGAYEDEGAAARVYGTLFLRKGFSIPVRTHADVNTSRPGEYSVRYTAELFDLEAEEVRTVRVVETASPAGPAPAGTPEPSAAPASVPAAATAPPEPEDAPPVLTLTGGESLAVDAAPLFLDPGCTAQDDRDGDLTAAVQVSGEVRPYLPGSYSLTYTVQDSAGNVTRTVRTVEVRAVPQPEQVDPGKKVIYLTFDDGPSENTARLLDVLDAYGVKATFFVTGRNPDYVNLIGEIYARGHSVGVHTASHDYDAIYASEEAFFADFLKMQDIIAEQTGVRTTLLRFPGGSSNTVSNFNPGVMTRLTQAVTDMGYQYFDWNVTAADTASNATFATVVENVEEGVAQHDASVVLQHDTNKFSVDAVETILRWAQENGYTFRPLDPTSPGAHHGVNN